jgi:hypothetical protein
VYANPSFSFLEYVCVHPCFRHQAHLPTVSSSPDTHSPPPMPQHQVRRPHLKVKTLLMAHPTKFVTTNWSLLLGHTVKRLISLGRLTLYFPSIKTCHAFFSVKEHVHFLKNVRDARAIRMRILECRKSRSRDISRCTC